MNNLRFALLIALAVASLQLGSVGISGVRTAAALTNCTVTDLSIDSEEARFLTLINNHRPAGTPDLVMSVELNRAATWFAADLTHSAWSHNDSLGRDPWKRMADCDVPPGTQGENIAQWYVTADDVFVGWMNSPGHNQNMLDARFTYIGIARVCCGPQGQWFWVTDFNSAGTPLTPVTLAPPTLTSVTAVNSTTIQLNFNDNETNESGFDYERKTGTGGTYALVLSGNALPGAQQGWYWPNNGLQPGTTYCYRIRARSGGSTSAYSNEACGTTGSSAPPAAPSGVSISVGGSSTLHVYFNDNATTETGFDYERKTGTGGTYAPVLSGNALPGAQQGWFWSNEGLQAGTTYCYRIRAKNGGSFSAYSNEACGATTGGGPPPAAPSGVSVSAGGSGTLYVLFNDNATTETGIEYSRRVGQNGGWSVVLNGNALPGAQSGWYWPNSGLNSGTQYCYRLRAHNGSTFSSYSNTACGTAP